MQAVIPRKQAAFAAGAGRGYSPREGSLAPTLVFVCLMLGLAIGWSFRETNAVFQAEATSEQRRRDIDLITARQSELGDLLADPRTQLARLDADAGASIPVGASVFWNPVRHDGVLFCRKFTPAPAMQVYCLWVDGGGAAGSAGGSAGDGRPARAATFQPAPGQTIYPFHCDLSVDSRADFVLTRGPAEAPPESAGVETLARGPLLPPGRS